MGANNDCALISESRTDNLSLMFRRGPGAKSAKRNMRGGIAPGHPSPHSTSCPRPRLVSRGFSLFYRVSIGKSLRRVSRFVSHRPYTKWKSGSRNRTDWE